MSAPLFNRSRSFYDRFVRKPGDATSTHYCPGCGHGNVHKFLAEAIDELGLQDRVVLISPVGCSVFAYYYFDTGNIQVAHGRAPAVATAVKRARPDSIVIVYQGDGDLAAIGTAEILHAANRGENLSVFFVNNAIYGMTGGQMAPTTLPGQHTTTTPDGRDVQVEGYPIKVCELLSQLDAPVYLERVALGDNKNNARTRRAVRRGLENQVRGIGFSLIEILSPCPTGWKQTPVEAASWTVEQMTKVFPLGVVRDRTAEATPNPRRRVPVAREALPGILGIDDAEDVSPSGEGITRDVRVKASGFGGQGALTIGLVLAEAGRISGGHVSWLPSYGPEMRGGTAHCHVCIFREPVGSPLITRPDVLFAMNLPSVDRFAPEIVPGGTMIVNTSMAENPSARPDIRVIGVPATQIAADLGNSKAANMVMLGAWLGAGGTISREAVLAALPLFFKKPAVRQLNLEALERGARAVPVTA